MAGAGAGAEGFSTITAPDEDECLLDVEAELVVDRASETSSSSSSSTVGWCHDGDGVRLVVGVSLPRDSVSVSVSVTVCGEAADVEA